MDSALQAFLGAQVYSFIMIFVRTGAAFLVLPILGETFVSMRIRLLLGVMISLIITPVMADRLPPDPAQPADLVVLIAKESVIGVFIGTIARIMMSALETAGSFIATQIGLNSAQTFNPALAQQGTAVSSILGISAILLLFASDLHHMLILAVVDSYDLFPPGQLMPLGDMTHHLTQVFSQAFLVGFHLSGPFVTIGLLFFLAMGLVSRLSPQIQIFFVTMPVQIGLGVILFGASLATLMAYWLHAFEEQIHPLLGS